MKQDDMPLPSNLRAIREERSLTLERLSELTGVSKSMLRQIETGHSSPTIATIWKIVNGLRISFTALLKKPAIQAEVRSFYGERPLTGRSEHFRVYPLVPFEPQQPSETYYVEIDPDMVFNAEPHDGDVYEYVYVIGGRLQITIDDKAFAMNQNEFLQFQANRPHEYKCLGKRTARAFMQVNYLS